MACKLNLVYKARLYLPINELLYIQIQKKIKAIR